jgi:hypothetical protein
MKVVARYPGVTLDTGHERRSLNLALDAPAGKCFVANGCHSLVDPFANNGGQSWKGQAYAELAERLEFGLMDCDCEECSDARIVACIRCGRRLEDRDVNAGNFCEECYDITRSSYD